MTDILILFFISLITLYYFSQRKPKNYPPTPFGFPILGHLSILGKEPHKILKKWKAKYGPIVGVDFGGIRCVAISDSKLIKEALADPNFIGRGCFPSFQFSREGGNKGLVFALGNTWVEQRRFTLRQLRDLGFGRKSMEDLIQGEIKELLEFFRSNVGKPISTQNVFNIAIVNALWTLVYGERFKRDDPDLLKIVKLLTSIVQTNSLRSLKNILQMHPNFVKWFPNLAGAKQTKMRNKPIVDYIKKRFEGHSQNYIQGQPRDFIDIFRDEINKTNDPKSSFYGKEAELQMVYTLFDLFVGGSETSSTTLSWMLLFLSHYTDTQDKLRAEIRRVVGNSRFPSLNDKPHLPFAEAVILETLRFSSLTPIGVFRSTMEDCEFAGYFLPKDTTIIANLWSVHFDEDIWGDPYVFRPERFLSKDEKSVIRSEHLMPFGWGKRVCLGEALARDEIFLFTTAIYQNFKINYGPNNPKPSLEPQIGSIVSSPKEHQLVFQDIN